MREFFRYVGVPYRPHGDTPAGWDCVGLVRWCARECGVVLPHYGPAWYADADADNSAAIARAATAWRRVPADAARLADVVVLKVGGVPLHLGFVLDGSRMLHVMRGRETVVECWTSRAWSLRVEGVLRWVA